MTQKEPSLYSIFIKKLKDKNHVFRQKAITNKEMDTTEIFRLGEMRGMSKKYVTPEDNDKSNRIFEYMDVLSKDIIGYKYTDERLAEIEEAYVE